MNRIVSKLSLADWDQRYAALKREGLREPDYGGPLRRHVERQGDLRLKHLQFDPSRAALRLWNFLLTENERLRRARAGGDKIIGAMKDLGTVPVMAYSIPGVRAFYPDGAWWTPCLMECSDQLLQRAEEAGLDASFCPVRAMVPAFQNGLHFPIPDLLVCSTGAVCDDFTALAQRLEHCGHVVFWWEIPRRRAPGSQEPSCTLPGGATAPMLQVEAVRAELERVRDKLAECAGQPLDDARLSQGVRAANRVRHVLNKLRTAVYTAPASPLPALEMLVAEMFAIHFCSDRHEAEEVLRELLLEVETRLAERRYATDERAARVFWVNPVADVRLMNLLEECGGRLGGSDFMFAHALDPLPEDVPPLEALARSALSDPMVGPTADRAERVVAECRRTGAEAVVVSRIPGASHCAREGEIIAEAVRRQLQLPVIELEIPPVCDAMLPGLRTRLQALVETVQARRTL